MTPLVPLVMFGWLPVVLVLFTKLPARRAVIVAFVVAWLFLPVARYEFSGLPEYTKMSATCVGILLAAVLFAGERFRAWRFHYLDLPMLLWCVSPCISSLGNGLGLYDGVSALVNQSTVWALPYVIGRLFLNDEQALRELCLGLFIGGLAYIPFCLYEGRMSPQLHRMFYGFHAHPDFGQSIRFGGYRPMVFMEHGLMVGMWMASASLTGVWLWHGRVVERLRGYRIRNLMIVQLIVTVLVKSMAALGLMCFGLGVLFASVRFRTRIFAIVLLMLPPLYIFGRTSSLWTGESLTDNIAKINADRAESLQFRLDNETILVEKAMQRPVFGWGGWGRSRVYNELGEDISTTDGLWIITLGKYGLFGLSMLVLTILGPAVSFVVKVRPAKWRTASYAPMAALSILLSLYMVDNLLNAMVNPIFILTAGGLAGMAARGWETASDTAEVPEILRPVITPAIPRTRFI